MEKPFRKKKTRGEVKMPEFSGRSWKDLEDIHPRHVRLSSDAHTILSGVGPALYCLRQDLKKQGIIIHADDIWLLYWIQRCEEAKENVATETYPVGKPYQWNLKLYYLKQSRLMRNGLIEWLPASSVKLVRVTAQGKDILKTLLQYVEQMHRNVKDFVKRQPEANAEKVQRYVGKYCFEWEKLNLESPAPQVPQAPQPPQPSPPAQ